MTEQLDRTATVRVAWCTPFSQPSAIGAFSALVVPALRDLLGFDVDIFFPEGSSGRRDPDTGFALGPDAVDVLRGYHHVIYNVGDNPANHGVFVALSRQVPGVMVLHDVSLIHLLLPDLAHGDEQSAVDTFVRWYGTQAADSVLTLRQGELPWLADPANIRDYPMIEVVAENAQAVVTHSQWAAERVRRGYVGDVWALPLPRAVGVRSPEPIRLPMLDDKPVILQAGVPNRNKHIPAVIEAFALAGLAGKANLVICGYGEQDAFDALQKIVDERKLGGSVHVLGRVDDATLDELRRRALISPVLRYPFGEAASAVLLDAMAYGHAVVTVDGGHYAEVPDDTVARIPVPPRAADIAPVLKKWITAQQEAKTTGQRAAAYVASRHNAEVYARGIADVLAQTGAYQRRIELTDRLARTLTQLGFSADDPIVAKVGDDVAELFAGEPRRATEIIYSGLRP